MPGIKDIIQMLRGGMGLDDVAKARVMGGLNTPDLLRRIAMKERFGNIPDRPKMVAGLWEGAATPLTKAFPDIPMPETMRPGMGTYRNNIVDPQPLEGWLGSDVESVLRQMGPRARELRQKALQRVAREQESRKIDYIPDEEWDKRKYEMLRGDVAERNPHFKPNEVQGSPNEMAMTSKPKAGQGMVRPKRKLTQEQFKALHEAYFLPIQEELGKIKGMPEQMGMPAISGERMPMGASTSGGLGVMPTQTRNRATELQEQARKIMGVMANKFEPPTENTYSRMKLNLPNPAEEGVSRNFPGMQPRSPMIDVSQQQAKQSLLKSPEMASMVDMPKMPITRIGWTKPGEFGEVPGTGMRFEKAHFKKPYSDEEIAALRKSGVLPEKGEMPAPQEAQVQRPPKEQKIADVVTDAVENWSMLTFVKGKGGTAGRLLKDFFEKVFKGGRSATEMEFDTPLEYFAHNMAKFKLGKIPEKSRLYPFLQSADEYATWVKLNMQERYPEAEEVMKTILSRNPGLFRKQVPPGFEDVIGQFSKDRLAQRMSKIEEERGKIKAQVVGRPVSKVILRKGVHAKPEEV